MRGTSREASVLYRPGVCASDKLVLIHFGMLRLRKEQYHIYVLLAVGLCVVDLKSEALGE